MTEISAIYRQIIENKCFSISWLYEVIVVETIKQFVSCDVHLGSESSKQITLLLNGFLASSLVLTPGSCAF